MDNLFLKKYLTEKVITELSVREYGKFMGIIIESSGYIDDKIQDNTSLQLLKNIDEQDGNESGFDKKTKNGLRIQVKFRQVKGKTLTSTSVHFSNTRRKSKKNEGYASKTGHVAYMTNEFDCVLIVLCHNSNKHGIEKRNEKYWQIVVIDVKNIIDPNNTKYCLPNIPSKELQKGVNWIKILEELDKK